MIVQYQRLLLQIVQENKISIGKCTRMRVNNQTALQDSDLQTYATNIGLDMDKWTTCLSDPAQVAEVNKDTEDAAAVGVTGTPAFFVNGVLLSGAVPYEQFAAIIDKELANK